MWAGSDRIRSEPYQKKPRFVLLSGRSFSLFFIACLLLFHIPIHPTHLFSVAAECARNLPNPRPNKGNRVALSHAHTHTLTHTCRKDEAIKVSFLRFGRPGACFCLSLGHPRRGQTANSRIVQAKRYKIKPSPSHWDAKKRMKRNV